ncbi:pilus assembly protein TadG-related protein [Devosia sp.]|uniref:TadE/TadG family type IV pilus assembly protein n=1 Tax=Devosia sp. TaxID=1871048 RepID=UPI001AC895C1|nr:pilus assembly protein TadG-related protein [Devosia sp.]MBN9333700.1 hypothetical protein [Devosia sp.]
MASKHFSRSPFRRFVGDERGAFAVMFGVMAVVLIALGGAVVDYVSLEQGRNRAQLALDAAALALQPQVFEKNFDPAAVQKLAQAFVTERVANSEIVTEILTTRGSEETGSLYFEAHITVPTIFVSLVGVHHLNATIESEATRKKLELEVVMVLDNSGSMKNESRMTSLVDAAKCATNILMYSEVQSAPNNANTCIPTATAERVENVRVAIVPFTMFVNVGPENANASWIDKTGASAIHFDNFDNDDDEDRLVLSSGAHKFPTRQQLFAATGEAWRGCVDARPHIKSGTLPSQYLDTDDTTPTIANGNTLFVPQFSPDLAYNTGGNNYITSPTIINSTYLDKLAVNGKTNWSAAVRDSPAVCDRPAQGTTKCSITEERTRTNSNAAWGNPYLKKGTPAGPTDFVSSALYSNALYGKQPPSCACRNPTYTTNWAGTGNTQTRDGWCDSFVPLGLSTRTLQERICKYYGAIGAQGFSNGPNADCTRTPILPLTSDPAKVIDTIDAMIAEGGTNIHEGTAWGFRVLTPGEPFPQAGASDNKSLRKVMIIMTDGENTDYNLSNYCNDAMRALNGKCFNTAYGFSYNSNNTSTTSTSGGNIPRLGSINSTNADLVKEMNQRTSDTCANAKDTGIEVYTIGLATNKVEQSTPAVVQAMLTGCASTASKAYFPNQSSELKRVFESIANELSALRLAR